MPWDGKNKLFLTSVFRNWSRFKPFHFGGAEADSQCRSGSQHSCSKSTNLKQNTVTDMVSNYFYFFTFATKLYFLFLKEENYGTIT
jgi:hypothetical protein